LTLEEETKPQCCLLIPELEDFGVVKSSLANAAREVGVEIISPSLSEGQLELFPEGEHRSFIDEEHQPPTISTRALSGTDLILADITGLSPYVMLYVGLASTLGKPIIFISQDPRSSLLGRPVNVLTYNLTLRGLGLLEQRVRSAFRTFKRNPARFRSTSPTNWRVDQLPYVDLAKLDPREFDNLCFELLTQMGYKNLVWDTEHHEIDAMGLLPRKDPDGTEYQELWLISLGKHAPPSLLFEMAIDGHLARRYFDSMSPAKSWQIEQSATLLFITPFDDHKSEFLGHELRRLQERQYERGRYQGPRLRVWDRRQLTQLIQQFPQLAFKYFSDEGRSQSKYRKSPQELYEENVALTERLHFALTSLKDEKDKRVIAEREAIWKEVSFKAAHKLGNPIFALETDLEALRTRIGSNFSDIEQIVDEMSLSIEKAKTIIEQFKSLARANDVNLVATTLQPLVESAFRIPTEKGVAVKFEGIKRCPMVLADAAKLADCFDEIAANALHWLEKEEKIITIHINSAKQKDLPEVIRGNEKFVRIEIRDNGCGVASDQKERIFDPFHTTFAHGNGLGLYIVQTIVQAHSGCIRETGLAGDGAVFEIFLPVAKKDEKIEQDITG